LLQKCPVGVGPPTWPLPCSCRVRRILHIMRIARWITIGAVLLALTPSIAGAQDKRFHVNFGGGPTFNAGDLGDHFANGWGPAIGVTIDGPNRKLAFQFEYAYRWFDIKDDAPIFGAT